MIKSPSISASRRWKQILVWGFFTVLLIYTILYLQSGFLGSQSHSRADLITRAREYDVFRQGLYPMASLVPYPVPKGFPYSVYPPYAQPMFGFFFGFGGLVQGWAMVHALSILSFIPISWIGWRSLRFAGQNAAMLGALAPIAITGNSLSLLHGQFSILCMGLISLQWLLLERRRPFAAGLCWAAAMLKPQIALAFAIPLLRRGNRRALLLGTAILLLLSAAALAFTKVSPLLYLSIWLKPKGFDFVNSGNISLMNLLGPGFAALGFLVVLGLFLASRGISTTANSLAPTLRTQGLCALLGSLAFYHLPYDNIMLYPALLAIFAQALKDRKLWSRLLAVAMALSLWAPVHLIADRNLPQSLSAGIWLLVGLTLLQPSVRFKQLSGHHQDGSPGRQ